MKRIRLSGVLLCFVPWFAIAAECGQERWSVKTGTDIDAVLVNQSMATDTTIETLTQITPTHPLPNDRRLGPTETTIWVLNATLAAYKLETDSDYHLVLKDDAGHTMIAEIPSPDCVGVVSPFAQAIARVRAAFDARFHTKKQLQHVSVPVQIKGVGFFDFLHGQTGVAPNGIELHPVLDIVFDGALLPTPGTPGVTPDPAPTSPTVPTSPVAPLPGEYKLITADTAERLLQGLNALASQGWVLVSAVVDPQRPDRYIGFLKRAGP